jgi:hypothetical protein
MAATKVATYSSAGRCIFCGRTEPTPGFARFGDEHIVPLAFGGDLIIPEATCKTCETIINRQIETPILSHEWRPLRDRLDWPTRKKGDRQARQQTFITMKDGRRKSIWIGDHSTPTILYRFDRPNILTGFRPSSPDANWTISMLGDTSKEASLREMHPDWDGRHKIKSRPYEFARLVAKISHAYAVAEWGLDSFSHGLTDLILGRDTDYFYRVGGLLDLQPVAEGEGNHGFELGMLFVSPTVAHLIVEFRFLKMIVGPLYQAVVGEIDLENPSHRRTFDECRRKGKLETKPLARP